MAALQTHGLTKRFGRLTAVDNLSLTIEEGDLYGFLGLNGAGKSTTIRMSLGLARPTAGHVTIFGKEARSHFLEVMSQIGALVEQPAYYPQLTGFRNVELMARLSGATAADTRTILERVGLAERADTRARTYSQGMLQRLGIAMALVGRPRLVILDEPTNGLDPRGILDIRELIKELNRAGTTFVISSHLLREIEVLCNRVGIIHKGRRIVEDTVEALLKKSVSSVRILAGPGGRDLLAKLDYVRDVRAEADALIVAVDPQYFARLNADLVSAGVTVSEFTPMRPTLEELFLSLQEAA